MTAPRSHLVGSDERTALYAAIAKVQAALTPVGKGHTADAGKYDYKFASIDAVWAALRGLLASNSLAVTQSPMIEPNAAKPILLTRVVHTETGEFEEFGWPLAASLSQTQAVGSELTYMRRYTLSAYFGIVFTNDDDDGGAAKKAHEERMAAEAAAAAAVTAAKTAKAAACHQLKAWGRPRDEWTSDMLVILDLMGEDVGDEITGDQAAKAAAWIKARIAAGETYDEAVLAPLAEGT